MSYKVKLQTFEGPFDLLVYLIENAQMSIYDIEIKSITGQYLEYIKAMQEMDIAVATEFMVLASSLIEIKSKMILPRISESGENMIEEDPRRELVARLVEYKKFKQAARILQEQEEAAAQEMQENVDSASGDTTQSSSDTGSADATQSSVGAGDAQKAAEFESSDTASDRSDSQTTEEAVEEESPFTEEQIEAKIAEYLPKTIEDIQTFGDMYDAPEQVESVFKWDVTDIFYNYFFIGNAINMGGENGWDTEQVDIYNLNAIQSMTAYQNLNNFFSIDTSAISYESTLNDFMQGKVVFTVATSDAVAALEQAKQDGTFAYEYGFVTTPSFKEEEPSSSLSVTNCVAINGYSTNQEVANDFARYLTCEYNEILYDRSGKVSAQKDMEYPYDALQVFAREYETSVPIPKMLETGNYWLKLEALFAEIWNGADANEELKTLSEQIKYQITGEQIEETYIEDTAGDGEEDEVEYLDEDYYRQQALDNQSE